MHVIHPFAPVFDENSRVLLLGTMPSPKSRESQFYYAHPQNRFWRILAALFQEEIPSGNAARTEFILKHHLALWDVLHSCEINGASDASIKSAVPNDLSVVLNKAPIRALFCTGRKSWFFYHRLIEPVIGRTAVCLPSTSPANCAVSIEKLCESYRQILSFI